MDNKIKQLIRSGVTDQYKIFDILYPEYVGHYSRLRNRIAEIKNKGLG